MSKLKDVLAAHGESVERLGDVAVTAVEQLAELTALLKRVTRLEHEDRIAYWNPRERQWDTRYRLNARDREAHYLYQGPLPLEALRVLVEGNPL